MQHRLHAVQVFQLQLLEEEHAGIVDPHVRQQGFCPAPRPKRIGRVRQRKVVRMRENPDGGLLPQLRSRCRQLLLPVADQHQVVAPQRQLPREFQSHAGTAARNQCDHRSSAFSTSRRSDAGSSATQRLHFISRVYIRPMQ